MVASRVSFVFLVSMFWVSSAQAALLGTCTFAGGCGPDFAVLDASVLYNYNGSTGTLTVTGTAGNASFFDGQLNPWPDASEVKGPLAGTDPNVSIPVGVASGLGNDDFLMTLTVDGSGNLLSGSISMNGKVEQFFSSLNNDNPAFQTPGLYTATSANGTVLDGALIAAGSSVVAMGFDLNVLDFQMTLDASSLLAQAYGSAGAGILSMSGISSSSGVIEWSENWSATGVLDVVVPVPAALWLFMSGLTVLGAVSRKRAAT